VPRIDRSAVILAGLVAFAIAIVAKAAQVQLWQHDRWAASAERQHFADASLPAPRGPIIDGSGRVLVESRELLRLRVAPREVRDRRALGRALAAAGVSREWVRRATDTTRKWVEIPGRFLPTEVAAAVAMKGVHPEASVERVVSASPGVRRIVGRVDATGSPVDGIELALDSLLTGTRGTRNLLRDGRGGRIESPATRTVAARPGHTVTLTLNYALQDIAEKALADATARMGATGGDIVVMDPKDGAVLAMASQRDDPRATAATALSEPFEPGSTLKPFTAAALLERKRTHLDEVVNTENGYWTFNGRTVEDVHKAPSMSLREIIRESSNIGIIKLAQRLSAREQFELYRDLGFGTPTGVPYPAESPGSLYAPARWSRTTPASLAIGYEVAVTPVQLAAAYAAIANGGELLEPSLVREIRDSEGEVRYRHARRVVRRVMSPEIAATVREMLESVVDSGSAKAASLASFTVGGKSGTARRAEPGRGYRDGKHNAVFAGIFPVEDPQFVIVVKVDRPTGVYYGGRTAAPITKVVLEAALAARDASLDRSALARRVRPAALDAYGARDTAPPPAPVAIDSLVADSVSVPRLVVPAELRRDTASGAGGARAPVRYVIDLPAPPRAATPPLPRRAVPAVQGLPLRDAVYALHRAGFRVRTAAGGGASAGRTSPAAGTLARPDDVVTLHREP
jgi:cell division protein FtsI (penicillin-binding protein 3)